MAGSGLLGGRRGVLPGYVVQPTAGPRVVGSLSVVAPLSSLEGLLTAVYAAASGDSFTPLLGAGIALAIVGSLLAAVHGRADSGRGALWALLTSVLWSLALVCFNEAGDISWLSQAAWSRLTGLVLILPIAAVLLRRSRATVTAEQSTTPTPFGRRRLVAGYLAAGLLDLGGLSAATLALAHGPLAVAGVTISQYATVAVILGLVFLRERPHRYQLAGVAGVYAACGGPPRSDRLGRLLEKGSRPPERTW